MNSYSCEAILKRHNPYWSQSPKTWDDSAFLGNGILGAAIYNAEHKSKRQTYRFVMGRVDVTARREGAYAARVPVGEFELDFGSWIYGGTTAEIDLYNARFSSDVVTVNGSGRVSAFIHSLSDLLVIDVETDEAETAELKWYSYPQVAEALLVDDGRPNIDQYFPEITLSDEEIDGVRVYYQQYNRSEDGCAAAFLCVPLDQGGRKKRYFCTVQRGWGQETGRRAVRLLREAAAKDFALLQKDHEDWWHDYFSRSMLSIPDTRLEGFYYIQMYKLACAARAHTPVMDTQGPWTGPTPWPGTWYNMNVQLAYAPVYASNHLEIGESLVNALRANMDNLIQNAPEAFRSDSAAMGRSMSHDMASPVGDEIGNLAWTCHNCYRQYRYSMDDGMLRDFLYPLLRRSMNFYFHLLKEGEDGKLHLPKTISPEYGSFRKLTVEDCNYDLFLMQWGIRTLNEICDRLHIDDPDRSRWAEIQSRLPDYPQDETGFLIGKGVRMEHGHRHYSHLMGIYPLHIIDCDIPENREKLITSLRHWFGMEGDLRGFTFAGAASLAATIGEGEEALRYLHSGMELCKPNTFYREAGPVIESPLGMAESLHDMLLQSFGGVIRIFPAVPEEWKDASFQNLRAEGAFLVSAQRKDGKFRFARIESLAGEPLTVACGVQTLTAKFSGGNTCELKAAGGKFQIQLKKGESVLLSFGPHCDEALEVCEPQPSLCNYWGGFKPWRLYGIPFAK